MDWEAAGLLEGLQDDAARAARRALLDKLYHDGAALDDLRRAVAEQRLALLPVERLLSSEARYTARDIAEATGLDVEFFQAHRRALGLAVPGPDVRVYGEADVDAARLNRRSRDAGFPDDEMMEVHRVLGRGMSRYAEAVRTLVGQTFLEPGMDEHELGERLERITRTLLPLTGPWLEHVFALHLREVLRRDIVTAERLATGKLDAGRDMAVAFADLVGFTELGETIPVEELGSVAGRLSHLAGEIVSAPVKLVKQIGDAVMLVSPEPSPMVDVALRFVEASEEDPATPALRVGVAFGQAVNRWGDWYGSPVNIASRLTTRARPASVLVTEAVRDAATEDYGWSFAGEKQLKGLAVALRTYRARRASD